MSDSCSYCSEQFGYDSEWDDIPKGEGHIEVTFNPEDEPAFVVEESRKYCSVKCVVEDKGNHPFGDYESWWDSIDE